MTNEEFDTLTIVTPVTVTDAITGNVVTGKIEGIDTDPTTGEAFVTATYATITTTKFAIADVNLVAPTTDETVTA